MGTSSKVYQVVEPGRIDDEDSNYAMKIINRALLAKQSPTADGFLAEFDALKKLDHPNIIKLVEVIDDKT